MKTYQIYKLLRQGVVSGDEIGKLLSISRTAVNKHIKKLREKGIVINSSSGIGYEWIKDNIVNEYAISYELEQLDLNPNVICKETVSTNIDAKSLAINCNSDYLIVAPKQSKGKGRVKRTFESDVGGAYFSLVVTNSNLPIATILRVVLIAGLAVHDVLELYNIKSMVKWPNDVYINDKKVAGILMELLTDGDYADKIIIGIGLNVNNKLSNELKKIATNIKELTNKELIIPQIISRIVKNLYYYIDLLNQDRWPEIKKKYIDLSYSINKKVEYNGTKGIAKGISDEGYLVVDICGREKKIITGDVVIC